MKRGGICLAILMSLALSARGARAQTTALFFDSQPGDYIGAGQTATWTPGDATFTTSHPSPGAVSMYVTGPPSGFWWSLQFGTSVDTGTPMAPGTYEMARREIFTPFNGLDVSGSGRGCNTVTGRFVVLEAEYDGSGNVLKFAADFEQHCDDNAPALFGAVRFNSTISTLVPFGGVYPVYRLTLAAPGHGTIAGGGLVCGTDGSQCVADHASPASAAIVATPDDGYVFAGWTGDCAGGPRTNVNINMQRTCSALFLPLVPAPSRTLAVLMALNSSNRLESAVLNQQNSTWTMTPAAGTGFSLKIETVSVRRAETNTFTMAPPIGQSFQAGVEYATTSSGDATHAMFSSSADSVSPYCSGPGTLAVREWTASGGVPTQFSIDFQDCNGRTLGTIQYDGSYAYGQLDVNPRALSFKAVTDDMGVVAHSADQTFAITPSGTPGLPWNLQSDEPWLTATPATGSTAVTVTAKIKSGPTVYGTGLRTAHLQPYARGIINVPDPVTVTLELIPADTTNRPFGVFRTSKGLWYLPSGLVEQFGLPGDVPLSGDFDGDTVPDIAVYRPRTGEWYVLGQGVWQWGLPGDIPVPADYDGDGITEIAVFRQDRGGAQWFVLGESAPRQWGLRGDIPVPGDYDGDGIADVAVFRPATGTWWIVRSSTGQTIGMQFGLPGDVPLVADFDGDRKIDYAVYRPVTGVWYITFSMTSGLYSTQFGSPYQVPAPADVTGDGRAELRLWNPSNGMWHSFDRILSQEASRQFGLPGDVPILARRALQPPMPPDQNGDRQADMTVFRPTSVFKEFTSWLPGAGYSITQTLASSQDGDVLVPGDYYGFRLSTAGWYRPSTGQWHVGIPDIWIDRQWGVPDDVPVPADYDGDGLTDIAVYRPSIGGWYILMSSTGYNASAWMQWGVPGDVPMPGDFDGDGRADGAVYRPSTGEWYVLRSSGGWFVRQWGLPGDQPIARDFDGDGRADFAVFRPSTGAWFVLDAHSGALILIRQWGLNGDVPAADDYDGDGVADLAVYRPSNQTWYVVRSSNGTELVVQWGLPGDVPVVPR